VVRTPPETPGSLLTDLTDSGSDTRVESGGTVVIAGFFYSESAAKLHQVPKALAKSIDPIAGGKHIVVDA
jgi:hypothetical protein